MGVYIKGMEMPTNCEKCPFLDYEEGFCLASGVKGKSGWYESVLNPGSIKDGRHDDCPLVPVPDHGRLIDADFLLAEYDKIHVGKPGGARLLIANAPTIIPASPADKDGEG